jgi:uncharacterized heparinase superfamily protein
MLIDDADPESYDLLLISIDKHMQRLLPLSNKATGFARLTALLAAVMGGICISAQDRIYDEALSKLLQELGRQILPDGGHISRYPGAGVEILLDLLPLRQCFVARDRDPPLGLTTPVQRIMPLLRHLQLGDRRLARFNGMPATELDRLAAVLVHDPDPQRPLPCLTQSRYMRLTRRQSVVIMDAGSPPPLEYSELAHAGALSFELSSGLCPIIVNCGAPGPADRAWSQQARGTAAHSTLVVDDFASARLSGNSTSTSASPFLIGPTRVEANLSEPEDGAVEVQSFHDGYHDRFGLFHARVLRLSAHGDRLLGMDRLIRPIQGVPSSSRPPKGYAVHFHIYPQVSVRRIGEDCAELTLMNGERWKFSADGAKLSIEDSLFFANFTGPARTLQLVLRGIVAGEALVRWRLGRVRTGGGRDAVDTNATEAKSP